MTSSDLFISLFASLGPLLAAEAEAEAFGTGVEAADLEQGVWLRFLERVRDAGQTGAAGPLTAAAVAGWLRAAVRSEARGARRRARREMPYGAPGAGEPAALSAEERLLAAETGLVLRAAVERLPGRCPRLLGAMLSPHRPTYRELADELGISQGSLGPVRSRCLGCLRRMLAAEVAAPGLRGRER